MANARSWISHHERMLGILIIMSLIILLSIRFVWLGETKPDGSSDLVTILRTIINGLISTIAVTTVVALAIRYIRPPQEIIESTSYIQSYDISRYLKDAAKTATEWIYYGHTGRYVRSAIFSLLLEQARRGRVIRVLILILDPFDEHLCDYYAQYRNSARTAMRGPQWTKETVQSELLATVLCAMELRASSPLINMEVGFVKHVSLFRIDLATARCLITQEDSQEPALGYESDSRFYEYYRRDTTMAGDQAGRLKQLDSVTKFILNDKPSCTATLSTAGLDMNAFPQKVIADAFKKALERKNPYD